MAASRRATPRPGFTAYVISTAIVGPGHGENHIGNGPEGRWISLLHMLEIKPPFYPIDFANEREAQYRCSLQLSSVYDEENGEIWYFELIVMRVLLWEGAEFNELVSFLLRYLLWTRYGIYEHRGILDGEQIEWIILEIVRNHMPVSEVRNAGLSYGNMKEQITKWGIPIDSMFTIIDGYLKGAGEKECKRFVRTNWMFFQSGNPHGTVPPQVRCL